MPKNERSIEKPPNPREKAIHERDEEKYYRYWLTRSPRDRELMPRPKKVKEQSNDSLQLETPEDARSFLTAAGILDETGKLSKKYRD